MNEKEAKDLIKRYAKRKQFLSVEDCMRINNRMKTTNSPDKK